MPFLKGFSGKFGESLGSGLAFGIVTLLGLVILRFIVADDIVRLTTPSEMICGPGSHDKQCVVRTICKKDEEIAVGGQCIIEDESSKKGCKNFALQNSGLDNSDWGFQCVWNFTDCEYSDVKVNVRAACVKKKTFVGLSISPK
jgi:hypothetical protein